MYQLVKRFWRALVRPLYDRTILVLTLLFCIGAGMALAAMFQLSTDLIEAQALQSASLSARALNNARTLYSDRAVSRAIAVEGITVTADYHNQPGAIPEPASYTIELAEQLSADDSGNLVRLYSNYPFPYRQSSAGPKDEFEWEALRYLEEHPTESFSHEETLKGRLYFRYAEAVIMQPSCVDCHNTDPASPKKDWRIGDVGGVLEITQPLDKFVTQTYQGLQGVAAMLVGVLALALTGLTLAIGRLRRTSRDLELRVIERTAELAAEQEKSDRLLLNILPKPIARDLKEGRSKIADAFSEVTVLFADLVQFTQLSAEVSAAAVVDLLNDIFSKFDRLTEKHGLEKIKTSGDAYMVAGGLPIYRADHAEAIAEMALEMRQIIEEFNRDRSRKLNIRIGIHTGPVVAGVIGTTKFIYDLWGDTVNVASRMESQGLVGEIQVTSELYKRLRDRYIVEARGEIQVKGKGKMRVYLLKGRASRANGTQ